MNRIKKYKNLSWLDIYVQFYISFNSKAKCNAYNQHPRVTTCPGSPLNALELQKGFSWPFFSSNRNTEASWPEGESPSFVKWSRSSEYNKSGLMTRQGMPNKNVGLFFRKALNPAPEVPHITFWMLDLLIYIINSLVEAPRPELGVK